MTKATTPDIVPRAVRPLAVALALVTFAGCGAADDLFCDGAGCGQSSLAWSRLRSLAGPLPAPTDPSNRFMRDLQVSRLGQAFYFDARFSGPATLVDAIGRPTGPTRGATKGATTNVSCATCHDLTQMGVDLSSAPNHVSSGAGWTDVNALATVNSAYSRLFFTNGRADSSWALNAAVAESGTTMNGDRLHTMWVIADAYTTDYVQKFGEPLPVSGPSCAMLAQLPPLDASGQCPHGPTGFCLAGCETRVSTLDAEGHTPAGAQVAGCWPTFPLHGKPGSTPGCQAGLASEPFGDAFDCMDAANQLLVTRVLVNWSKAIAAFEGRLVTGEAPFDEFVKEGPGSTAIDALARRGAELFVGKAGCFDCHNGPLLSDRGFHDIGVPQAGAFVPTVADCVAGNPKCDCVSTPAKTCLPWGAYDGLTRLAATAKRSVHLNFLRDTSWSDGGTLEPEELPGYVPPESLKGAWRTPSLRNVELTGPYMHDGLYKTLAEVVWHYSNGADPSAVGRPAADVKPLRLADDEQRALVAFLRTLTSPQPGTDLSTAPPLPSSVCP
jgi:cytochrome c peroxidase